VTEIQELPAPVSSGVERVALRGGTQYDFQAAHTVSIVAAELIHDEKASAFNLIVLFPFSKSPMALDHERYTIITIFRSCASLP